MKWTYRDLMPLRLCLKSYHDSLFNPFRTALVCAMFHVYLRFLELQTILERFVTDMYACRQLFGTIWNKKSMFIKKKAIKIVFNLNSQYLSQTIIGTALSSTKLVGQEDFKPVFLHYAIVLVMVSK